MIGLARAASSLSRALGRLFTPASRLDGLKVMVLGLGDPASREVVCALSRQKARVTVIGDAGEVELMGRDLELLGSVAALAPLDTIDASEVRLMADNFRALGQLPNVMVCCGPDADAAASVLLQALQPTLALHLIRGRPGASPATSAAGAFSARSLSALLDDPDLFDPARPLSKVRLGARLFHVRRREAARAGRRQTGRPAEPSKAARRPGAVQRPHRQGGSARRERPGPETSELFPARETRNELTPLRPDPHPAFRQGVPA